MSLCAFQASPVVSQRTKRDTDRCVRRDRDEREDSAASGVGLCTLLNIHSLGSSLLQWRNDMHITMTIHSEG